MNPINLILWLIILIVISFVVAGFCAPWYILIHPLSACVPALSGLADILLQGIQFPHYCAQQMLS